MRRLILSLFLAAMFGHACFGQVQTYYYPPQPNYTPQPNASAQQPYLTPQSDARTQYVNPAQQQYNAPAQPVNPAQPQPMYDQNYTGPVNTYGQPVFSVPDQPARQAQSPQQTGGIFGAVGNAAYGAGSYLWSYAPDPMRGGQNNPYYVPPGTGQVYNTYVPGTP
jgi:hypothetical protein